MMAELEERAVLWVRGVPERDAPTGSLGLWLESTRRGAAIVSPSARVELTIGLTLVLSFDALDLEHAVERAQALLQIGKEQDPPMSVHIGLALGDIGRGQGDDGSAVFVGAAFDRAQLLSQRARPYEIVFDEAAEQRGEELWLFAREIWSDRVRGYVLEPVHWSKRACRDALAQLRPAPLTKTSLPVFDQLQMHMQQRGQQRVALHAAARASALDLVSRLVELSPPSLLLCVSESAGSLRPLGSLALAVRRMWPTEAALHAAGLPIEIEACLLALATGRAVQRADLVEGLSGLLRLHAQADDHRRAFIVLEELPEIDPASLAVLAEVLMEPELDALVLMTLPLDASVPAQLMPAEALHELYLPPLPVEDRITIAEAALCLPAGSEIAQRVALLGGAHLHGLLEAIRTLVSSGDLIWSGEAFSWRIGPRQGAATVPIEALLTERVVGLPPGAYRVLEVACSCPILAPAALLEQVAARDGVSTEEFAAGLVQLQREGLMPLPVPLGGSDAVLRGVMRNLIPPARAAELHRYAAESLRALMPDPCFGSGEIAYHLLESGQVPAAAQALVEAAHCAMDTGFQRMALRLLATAVEWDPSTQIRKAARALARVVSVATPPPSEPKVSLSEAPQSDEEYEELKSEELGQPLTMSKSAMRSALDALAQRDFDGAERWLDAALAAGGERAAIQRVLSLSHVMRGDLESAITALQRSQSAELPLSVRARETLCWAIVRLAAGDANDAIRTALIALAVVRDLGDTRGEAAVLRVLSMAYRSLDRDEDALQLEAAAVTRLRGFVPMSHPA